MLRARFISGLCDFTWYFNFRYFARAIYNKKTWIHSSLVPRRSPPDHPSRLGAKYRDVTE